MARFEAWRRTRPLHTSSGKIASSSAEYRYWLWSSQLTLALFMLRKVDRPLLVASNRWIPVKTTLEWSADAFCASTIMRSFIVVFCVLRGVHTFDFGIVIKETPNKWRSEEKRSCSDDDSCFLHNLYFPPPSGACVEGSYKCCAGQLLSLE